MAFIDGVRHGEASLYAVCADGSLARGVAGVLGAGAVICSPATTPVIAATHIERVVIWSDGAKFELPDVSGGWGWVVHSVAKSDPKGPLDELQLRMRRAEESIAVDLIKLGHLVIVDGPLYFPLRRDLDAVGYIKTHHRPLLKPEHRSIIRQLGVAQRTSLFQIGTDRYSSYIRIAQPSRDAGPWAGIVRIDLPASNGIEQAVKRADMLASRLPRYAGVPHRDARAPQNLQPIGGLEHHLRHLLGHPGLGERAVREAVRTVREMEEKKRG